MMSFDWQSNMTKRIVTGAAIIAVLAIAFSLRFIPVAGTWIFDVFIIALALFAAWDVLCAKQACLAPKKTKPNVKEKATPATEETKQVKEITTERSDIFTVAIKNVSYINLCAYMVVAFVLFILGVATDFAWWLHLVMQIVAVFIFMLHTTLMNYMDGAFIKECKQKKLGSARASLQVALETLKIMAYPILLVLLLIPVNHLGEWVFVTMPDAIDAEPVGNISTFVLLTIFLVSMLTDTFAYAVGSIMHGKKLVPRISPNKTISGAVGGLFGGMTGALLALLITVRNAQPLQEFFTLSFGYANAVQIAIIAIGFAGSIVTQLGDIYASYLKRRCGIKDYGQYLPGHGGVMDRIDGIIVNTLFMFIIYFSVAFLG